MREVIAHLSLTHFRRVAFVVKEYILLDPADVGLFGSDAAVSDADQVTNLIEKFRHCDLAFGSCLNGTVASEVV